MDYYWWLRFLRRYPTLLLTPSPQPYQLLQPFLQNHLSSTNNIDEHGKPGLIFNRNLHVLPPIPPPQTPEDELKLLEGYKKLLEEDLAEIQRELIRVEERIKELKSIINKNNHKEK